MVEWKGAPKANRVWFVSINPTFIPECCLAKNFRNRGAHSDILPRFISVPGASVPRVQEVVINQKQKGTREYEFGYTERTLRE
jgi:hypothetical protein